MKIQNSTANFRNQVCIEKKRQDTRHLLFSKIYVYNFSSNDYIIFIISCEKKHILIIPRFIVFKKLKNLQWLCNTYLLDVFWQWSGAVPPSLYAVVWTCQNSTYFNITALRDGKSKNRLRNHIVYFTCDMARRCEVHAASMRLAGRTRYLSHRRFCLLCLAFWKE